MKVAKITKGQVTIPINIRQQLKLDDDGKVAFIEKDGQYIIANPTMLAFEKVQKAFRGEAERLGLRDVDDVVKLVKDVRSKWHEQ